METKTFQVPNMTCNGCVSTVKGEIEQLTEKRRKAPSFR